MILQKRFFLTKIIGMFLILGGLTATFVFSNVLRAEDPTRLKRSESFLGVHFDFHAQPSDQNIGQNTTPEMVNTILDMVQPDYIQIDCKGHAGFSSYPTKVGNQAGSFVGDPLKVWREVTSKRGVSLFMHYSGVWDGKAVTKHPDWAVIHSDGNHSPQKASVFGSYVDQLLIPQLLELANEYGVDGVWIDGECWATEIDYSDKAKAAFSEKTGIKDIPTNPSMPGWYEWTQFHREAFREYVRHYITEIKKEAPDFQIASNWAFTDHMPEAVCAPVDYISGDYSHSSSVNSARFSSRYMSTQGIAWDLMAWSFSTKSGVAGWSPKTSVQLEREAACVLAQGGGFQAYYTQNRDGSLTIEKLKTMQDTAKFCRERQPFCFQTKAVPQIAMLLNTGDHYRRLSQAGGGLFSWSATWQRPMLNALLKNQYSVEVFNEKNLTPVIGQYPLVVVDEWGSFEPELKETLVKYVENGGNLLLVGTGIYALFEQEFKDAVSISDKTADAALQLKSFGKGKFVWLAKNASDGSASPELIRSAVQLLAPEMMVSVQETPMDLDISVRKTTDGKLTIHLVNASGPHEAAGILESIDPVGPATITVQTGQKPNKVVLQPENKPIDFVFDSEKGTIQFKLDKIAIYDIVVIE